VQVVYRNDQNDLLVQLMQLVGQADDERRDLSIEHEVVLQHKTVEVLGSGEISIKTGPHLNQFMCAVVRVRVRVRVRFGVGVGARTRTP